jgi:uncharacterized protein (UPF0210 family)
MLIHPEEILETINMVTNENLDIRTVTMGINLRGCCHPDIDSTSIYNRILRCAETWSKPPRTSSACIPIINKRISVTDHGESCQADFHVPWPKSRSGRARGRH